MSARILDGNEIAAAMREELRSEVEELREQRQITPGLAVVLVGDAPASQSYVRNKGKACRDVGIHSVQRNLEASATLDEVLEEVERLNADPAIHGILVQLPLPDQDESQVLNAIAPGKDVDGLHPLNLGKLLRQEEGFLPCTPHGVQQILLRSGIPIAGQHVVVVGRSTLVGRPVANILLQKAEDANATVTLCHSGTADLAAHTRSGDIVIVAAGHAQMIGADMIRDGATVIDVGINFIPDPTRKSGRRMVGDVDFEAASQVAGAITPVPGGVGPMTITMLLYNTIWSAKRHHGPN